MFTYFKPYAFPSLISWARPALTLLPRYLQAILDETLRVKPPSGGGFRLAEEELQIGGAGADRGPVGLGESLGGAGVPGGSEG